MKKSLIVVLLMALTGMFLSCSKTENNDVDAKYSLYKLNNKYGLIDSERNIVLEAKFDEIKYNEVYLCTSETEGNYVYTEDLDVLHKFEDKQHSVIMCSPDVFYYKEGEKPYEIGFLFSLPENKIVATRITGVEGNISTEPWITSTSSYFKSDLETFTRGPANDWDCTYPYRENRAVVLRYTNSSWIGEIIDEDFSSVLGDLAAAASYYSEGLLPVVTATGESCYVDLDGNVVHTCDFDFDPVDRSKYNRVQLDLAIGSFVDGVAVVKAKDKKWIVLDRDFNEKYIPEEFSVGEEYQYNEYGCWSNKEIDKKQVYNYSNGLLPVWKMANDTKMYGYLDTDCNLAIPCIFTDAEPFVNGYAIVKYEDKDAIVDVNGNIYLSEDMSVPCNLPENAEEQVDAKTEYQLTTEKKDYLGTYIPYDFCLALEETKSLDDAYRNIPRDAHYNLFMNGDSCYSTRGGEYEVINSDIFKNYEFFNKGNDWFVKDEKGFIYKRISLKTDFSEIEFRKFIQKIMFGCMEDLKNVQLVRDGAVLEIDGVYHKLVSFYESIPGGKAAPTGRLESVIEDFYLRDGENFLAAKLSGISATFYVVKKTNKGYEYTNEVKYDFPIFSYTPMIPLENMTKEELRLYRNIQFARHGYNFKSPDLQEIFSQFEWYKPAPADEKIVLTKEEQDIVDTCLKYEALSDNERTVLKNIEPDSLYNSGITIAHGVPIYTNCNEQSKTDTYLDKGTFVQLFAESTNPDNKWYEIRVPYSLIKGYVSGNDIRLYCNEDEFNKIKDEYKINEIFVNNFKDNHHILFRVLISNTLEVTRVSADYETVVQECNYFNEPFTIQDSCYAGGKIIGKLDKLDKVKILEVATTNNYTDDWKDSLEGYCLFKVQTGELSGNVTGWVFGDKDFLRWE